MKSPISRRAFLSAFGGAMFLTSGAIAPHASGHLRDVDSVDVTSKKFIGHRGAAGLAPQNTKEGIHVASEYGMDGVELDVQQTGDGELVLFHDPIYRVATDNGYGRVSEIPLETAKTFHKDGHYVISLVDGIETIIEHDLELYLEIKSSNILSDCYKLIEEYNWVENTYFISLDKDNLLLQNSAKSNFPGKRAEISTPPLQEVVNSALEAGFDGAGAHYAPYAQKQLIERINKNGLDSIIWNLFDTEASLRHILKTNANVIVTNRPDMITEFKNNENVNLI